MKSAAIFLLGISNVVLFLLPTIAQEQAPAKETPPSEQIECMIGGRSVKLALTGSAVRKERILSIYNVDSYVEQGVKVRKAQDLVVCDQAKQLRLLMLRSVSGPKMADAFTDIFRGNHPEPAFNEEIDKVTKILESQTVKKGDAICFTHVPKVGFEFKTPDNTTHLIRNVEFSKAVWENYFGKHNVGEKVKKDLLSRLGELAGP